MRIFVTGASGYIGEAVARRLLEDAHMVSGLVRRQEAADRLRAIGIAPVLGTLDAEETLREAAQNADAVVHTADADHERAVEVLLGALTGTGKAFIHTSGSSLVGDRAAGEPSDRVYAEDTPLTPQPDMRRRLAINQRVVDAARDGLKSIVIVPSMIYGDGGSFQVPLLIDTAKQAGVARHVGRGLNRWSNVHRHDLADLYVLALERSAPGEIYYAGAGEAALRDITSAISRMLGLGGVTEDWPLEDAVRAWGRRTAEVVLGNNSRVSSEKARMRLGWRPHRADLLADVEHGSYAARHVPTGAPGDA